MYGLCTCVYVCWYIFKLKRIFVCKFHYFANADPNDIVGGDYLILLTDVKVQHILALYGTTCIISHNRGIVFSRFMPLQDLPTWLSG